MLQFAALKVLGAVVMAANWEARIPLKVDRIGLRCNVYGFFFAQ